MDANADLQAILDEMQLHLKRQYDGMDSIRSTARSLFSASSLVVTIIGTLRVLGMVESGLWSWAGLILVGVLYIAVIWNCSTVQSIASMKGPIEPVWETLREHLVGKRGRALLALRISALLNAIGENERTLARRKRAVDLATYLLPALVTIVLLLGTVA